MRPPALVREPAVSTIREWNVSALPALFEIQHRYTLRESEVIAAVTKRKGRGSFPDDFAHPTVFFSHLGSSRTVYRTPYAIQEQED